MKSKVRLAVDFGFFEEIMHHQTSESLKRPYRYTSTNMYKKLSSISNVNIQISYTWSLVILSNGNYKVVLVDQMANGINKWSLSTSYK